MAQVIDNEVVKSNQRYDILSRGDSECNDSEIEVDWRPMRVAADNTRSRNRQSEVDKQFIRKNYRRRHVAGNDSDGSDSGSETRCRGSDKRHDDKAHDRCRRSRKETTCYADPTAHGRRKLESEQIERGKWKTRNRPRSCSSESATSEDRSSEGHVVRLRYFCYVVDIMARHQPCN